jgi:hypothetical protein
MRCSILVLVLVAACGQPAGDASDGPDAGVALDAAADQSDAAVDPATCSDVTDATATAIGTATGADDYALSINAHAASSTSWGTVGNEGLILEVNGASRGLIGHLILHQGHAAFEYTMHLGALAAGEAVSIKVSTLSAPSATRSATVCAPQLVAVSAMGAMADGIVNAPIYRWPVQKRFNDVPLVVGWSKVRKAYEAVMTNEDGGTAEQCGGGASGMQAEIARWGRSTDIELHYGYGGTAPTWERCSGRVATTTTAVRTEGAHPIFYYGDGHNRLFESRGGYGQTCGTGSPEKPDGDFTGWNVASPGNALADDAGHVIILRPLPVDMDAIGFAQFGGRREALSDRYAPWMYRIASLELSREGKIDSSKTFGMSRYLYVDVRVSDVGGSGDEYCATLGVSGGFKLRAVTKDGTVISSPQITAAYAGNGNHDWKRVAIALPSGVTAADVDHFVFDAYDDDGIYVTALGDAFIAIGNGTTNGAKLDYVRQGTKALQDYVDDGSSGCTNGVNTSGPGGLAYTCVGGQIAISLP